MTGPLGVVASSRRGVPPVNEAQAGHLAVDTVLAGRPNAPLVGHLAVDTVLAGRPFAAVVGHFAVDVVIADPEE